MLREVAFLLLCLQPVKLTTNSFHIISVTWGRSLTPHPVTLCPSSPVVMTSYYTVNGVICTPSHTLTHTQQSTSTGLTGQAT